MSYNVGTDISAPSIGPHPYPGGAPTNGVSEVQTITSAATGGTFALILGAYRSAALPYNASAAQIQAALAAMPAIGSNAAGASNVACAGGPLGTGGVTATFQNDLSGAAPALMTVDNTNATGGAVTVAMTTQGVVGTLRGAPTGALLVDTTNGELYINQGTRVSPTWTKIGP